MRKAYIADFGAGNTCLYSVVLDTGIADPVPLTDIDGEPSGYAVDKRGNILLGRGLYKLGWDDLSRIDKFHINIKAIPNETNAAEMTEYFRMWFQKVKREHPEEFEDVDEQYWLIGCPTGDEWKSKETREKYKIIFEKAGFENILVIPESNAALAFYQKTQGALEGVDENAGLILLDQGAYSLDATYFGNGEIRSVGSYLGAGLVEQLMIHTILYDLESEYRQGKWEHNSEEVLEYARRLYEKEGEQGGKFRTFLLLGARELKEDYFKRLRNGSLKSTSDLTTEIHLSDEVRPLRLFTNRKMMEDILNRRSVRSILRSRYDALHEEVKKELEKDGQECTWTQAFENFLEKVDKMFPDFAASSKSNTDIFKKPVILLTGGGCMMDCVSEKVKMHYPTARVHIDPEAIFAIGKGMAYWAPDKIRAEDLSKAFSDFLEKKEIDEDGQEDLYLCNLFFYTMRSVASNITQNIMAEEADALAEGLKDWKNYQCQSQDIPKRIKSHMNAWQTSTGVNNANKIVEEAIRSLKQNINDQFKPIFKRVGISDEELLACDNNVFLSISKRLLEILFQAIVDHIIKFYKNALNWEVFPNGSKGLFSDKRNDFLVGRSEELKKFLEDQLEQTRRMCWHLFFKFEYEFGEKIGKDTIYGVYVLEALGNIYNEIEERKKQLVGKLVIEEYFED